MSLDYDSLVFFAKTFGLVYLVVFFVVAAAWIYWPGRRDAYERAGRSVLDDARPEERS